jgi:hypothetical protein
VCSTCFKLETLKQTIHFYKILYLKVACASQERLDRAAIV